MATVGTPSHPQSSDASDTKRASGTTPLHIDFDIPEDYIPEDHRAAASSREALGYLMLNDPTIRPSLDMIRRPR